MMRSNCFFMGSSWTLAAVCVVGSIAGSVAGALAEEPKCPLEGAWKFCPEFSDEFNEISLDDSKWRDFNPSTFIGRQPGLFCRENVTVADGCLQLTASRMPKSMETVENQTRGFHTFATAIVKSKKRLVYGYLEARCRAMNSGATSAFWLYDPLDPDKKYVPGNWTEEIDVFEIFGKHPNPQIAHTCYMTVHRQKTPYVETLVRIDLQSNGFKWVAPHDFVSDFHTFGLLWTESELVWFVDGQERWRRPNEFHKNPLYIMFDSEIMEKWNGLPDLEDLPSVFSIDYLRVWQSAAE